MDEFNDLPEGMPEYLADKLQMLKDLMTLRLVSDNLQKLAHSTMELGSNIGSESVYKMGNIAFALSAVAMSKTDIDEVNDYFTEFAAKKLRAVLAKGDKNSDRLMDTINSDMGSLSADVFSFLEGKKTLGDIKKMKLNKDEKPLAEDSTPE